MKYKKFEKIVSPKRMERYLIACNNTPLLARRLYALNQKLSCEMFVIVCGFEIALRNAINNKVASVLHDPDWLGNSVKRGGVFYNLPTKAKRNIKSAARKLRGSHTYSPDQMVASMEFGTWKYMFSKDQYVATGQCLLSIFPDKPKSTRQHRYNRRFLFNELDHVNSLRNRIAHHEPICFTHNNTNIDLSYVTNEYNRIFKLLEWMKIDKTYFSGQDQVMKVCAKIENFRNINKLP